MESVRGFKKFLKSKAFVLVIMLIVMAAVFTILSGGMYISLFNIRNIIRAAMVSIFLTTGAVFLMICGYIDLSTSMVGNFGAVLVALFLSKDFPWPIAVILVLVVTCCIGLINATLVCKLNFAPFIATMAMSYVIQGFMYMLCEGSGIPIKHKGVTAFGAAKIGNLVPLPMIIALIVLIVAGIVLSKTYFGKSIYMIGGNPRAARLCGYDPEKMAYKLFGLNAMLGACGGMLLAFSQKTGQSAGIASAQFSGMTGAILGGVSFGGGSGGMGGAFIGLMLLNGFQNGLTCLGVPAFWQTFANGALLLIALTFDFVNNKRLNRIKK